MATPILEQQKLEALLGMPAETAPRRRRWMIPAAALIVLAAAVGVWRLTSAPKPAQFTTAPVRRQTIVKTISATGTLQAVTTVQVGTQASGTISELYADFNSQVQKGQVIARLDPVAIPGATGAGQRDLVEHAGQPAVRAEVMCSRLTPPSRPRRPTWTAPRRRWRMRRRAPTAPGNWSRPVAAPPWTCRPRRRRWTRRAAQKQQAVAQVNQAQSAGPGRALPGDPGAGAGRAGQSGRRPGPGQSGLTPSSRRRSTAWWWRATWMSARRSRPASRRRRVPDRQRPHAHAGAGEHRRSRRGATRSPAAK